MPAASTSPRLASPPDRPAPSAGVPAASAAPTSRGWRRCWRRVCVSQPQSGWRNLRGLWRRCSERRPHSRPVWRGVTEALADFTTALLADPDDRPTATASTGVTAPHRRPRAAKTADASGDNGTTTTSNARTKAEEALLGFADTADSSGDDSDITESEDVGSETPWGALLVDVGSVGAWPLWCWRRPPPPLPHRSRRRSTENQAPHTQSIPARSRRLSLRSVTPVLPTSARPEADLTTRSATPVPRTPNTLAGAGAIPTGLDARAASTPTNRSQCGESRYLKSPYAASSTKASEADAVPLPSCTPPPPPAAAASSVSTATTVMTMVPVDEEDDDDAVLGMEALWNETWDTPLPPWSWWLVWLSSRRFWAVVLCAVLVILADVLATVGHFNCTYFLRGRLCHRPGQETRYDTVTSTCAAPQRTDRITRRYTIPMASLRQWMEGAYVDLRTILNDDEAPPPPLPSQDAHTTPGETTLRRRDAQAHLTKTFTHVSAALRAHARATPAEEAHAPVHLPLSRRLILNLEARVAGLVAARRQRWQLPRGPSAKVADTSSPHRAPKQAAPSANATHTRPTRIRFASYTNNLSPNGCTLVASAALSGAHYTLLGFQQPYGHFARHLRQIEWIAQEGLADDDVIVITDSDVTWTGADVAPFLAKFIDLSPAEESMLDVAKVRAWEDYGEALAPLVVAGLRPDEVLAPRHRHRVNASSPNNNTTNDNHGREDDDGSEARRRWSRLVQMPPVLFNAESACQRSQAVRGEAQCQSEADLLELMIAARRNQPQSIEKDLLAFAQPWSRDGEEDQSRELWEASARFLAEARAVLEASFVGATVTPSQHPFASTLSPESETVRKQLFQSRRPSAAPRVPRGEEKDHHHTTTCVPARPRYWGIEHASGTSSRRDTTDAREEATSPFVTSGSEEESIPYSVFHYLDGATRLNPASAPITGLPRTRRCSSPRHRRRRGGRDAPSAIKRRVAETAAAHDDDGDDHLTRIAHSADDTPPPTAVPAAVDTLNSTSSSSARPVDARPTTSTRVRDSVEVPTPASAVMSSSEKSVLRGVLAAAVGDAGDSQRSAPTPPPLTSTTSSPFEYLSDVLARDMDTDDEGTSPVDADDRDVDMHNLHERAVDDGDPAGVVERPPTTSTPADAAAVAAAAVRDASASYHYHPHARMTRSPADADYFFPNMRGTLNTARHLNAGGLVARVWAYKQLVAAMVQYAEEHFPLDLESTPGALPTWLRTHGGKHQPVSAAAREAFLHAAADPSPHHTPKPADDRHPSTSSRCRAEERGWHNDQSIIASMYVYGRIWEVEENLLVAPFTAPPTQAENEPAQPLRLRDPFGLSPGLIGVDRASEFFFVTPFMEKGRHYAMATELPPPPSPSSAAAEETASRHLSSFDVSTSDVLFMQPVRRRVLDRLVQRVVAFITAPLAWLWQTDASAKAEMPLRALMREANQSETRVRHTLTTASVREGFDRIDARVGDLVCPLYLFQGTAPAASVLGNESVWSDRFVNAPPAAVADVGRLPHLWRRVLFPDSAHSDHDQEFDSPSSARASAVTGGTRCGKADSACQGDVAHIRTKGAAPAAVSHASGRAEPRTAQAAPSPPPSSTALLKRGPPHDQVPWTVWVTPPLLARLMNTQDALRVPSASTVESATRLASLYRRALVRLSVSTPANDTRDLFPVRGDDSSVAAAYLASFRVVHEENGTNVSTFIAFPDQEERARALLSRENRCLLNLVTQRWLASHGDAADANVTGTHRVISPTPSVRAGGRLPPADNDNDDWETALTACLAALRAAQSQLATTTMAPSDGDVLWRRALQHHCALPIPPATDVPTLSETSTSTDTSAQTPSWRDVWAHSTHLEAAAELGMRETLWRAHHMLIASFPRIVHFAGDWKDIRFREHRHGLTWFLPGRYDAEARALNEAVLRELEVEWVSTDTAHYFSYEAICGSPYVLV